MGHKNDSMVISIAPLSSITIKICPLVRQLGQISVTDRLGWFNRLFGHWNKGCILYKFTRGFAV